MRKTISHDEKLCCDAPPTDSTIRNAVPDAKSMSFGRAERPRKRHASDTFRVAESAVPVTFFAGKRLLRKPPGHAMMKSIDDPFPGDAVNESRANDTPIAS